MPKKKEKIVKVKRKKLTLVTNKSRLMSIGVMTRVTQPYDTLDAISCEGKATEPRIGLGAVNYTMKLKDNIFKYVGDHAEPYVSARGMMLMEDDEFTAMTVLEPICIGNEALICDVEYPVRWTKGWVVGKHGGVEHIMIYFSDKVLDKIVPYNEILIKAYGQGLKLLDFPEVKIMNIDPRLFEKINLKIKKGRIKVPVTGIVPAKLMGSGLGSTDAYADYDIMNSDMTTIRRLGLDKLKIGDLVAIEEHYVAHGFAYKESGMTIGVIVHGACLESGHGAGVCPIMTDLSRKIEPIIVKKSNIDQYHVW